MENNSQSDIVAFFAFFIHFDKSISLGALQSMHKDGQSVYKTPIVQLIGKNIEGGQLRSVTLSEGWSIGHAVPTSSS